MGRFIEGADRRQATLLPDTIDDYVGEENPVRVVDAFVEMLDLAALGFDGVDPRRDRAPELPSGDDAQDLRLRLSQPGAVLAAARARVRAQPGADLAHGPPGARLQDDRRFPTRQRPRHPQGLPAVRRALPRSGSPRRRLVAIDGSKFKAVNATKNFTPRSSSAGWARSTPRSTAIWPSSTAPTRCVAQDRLHADRRSASEACIKKLAHTAKRRARWQPSSSDGQHRRDARSR